MADNPLFPSHDNGQPQASQPGATDNTASASADNPAADLIRQKLHKIYADEPDAQSEIKDAANASGAFSKHQRFMHELQGSGKSLADIQTAWHNYYIGLPDDEKHQVWQEFYEANARNTQFNQFLHNQIPLEPAGQKTSPQTVTEPKAGITVADHTTDYPKPKLADSRSIAEVKRQLLDKVSAGGKLKARHHFQSLLFGAATGLIVVIIFLFGFFNEVFIAPFIQPNSHASATPVIIDPNNITVGSTPEVIIPKINVEIPVDYSQTSTSESVIENALNDGVVHYPSTVMPGQIGNTAIFGHSSNNIFNPGKYKFAFVLLHELVPGDTFYLTKDGKAYVYKVISKTIVDPSDVGVLNPIAGQTATATLITCDPPGTSLRRLVVVGAQISPDPSTDTNATLPAGSQPSTSNLPGNGPTLWSRFWHWL